MSIKKYSAVFSCCGIIIGVLFIMCSIRNLCLTESSAVINYLIREFTRNNCVETAADHIQTENDKKLVLLYGKTSTEEVLTDSLFNVSVDNSMSLNRIVEMYQWIETQHRHTTGSGKNIRVTYTYTYKLGWSREIINSAAFRSRGYNNPGVMLFNPVSICAKSIKIGAFRVAAEVVRSISKEERIEIDPTKVTLSGGLKFRNNQILYNVYEEQKNRKKENSPDDDKSVKPAYEVNEIAPRLGDVRIYYTKNPVCDVTILGQQKEDKILPFKSDYQVIFEVFPYKISITDFLSRQESKEDVGNWFSRIFCFFLLSIGLFLVSNRMNAIGCLFSLTLSFTIANGIFASYWMSHHFQFGIMSLVFLIIGGLFSIVLLIKGIAESSSSLGSKNSGYSSDTNGLNFNGFKSNNSDFNSFNNNSFKDNNVWGNNSSLDNNNSSNNGNFGHKEEYSRTYNRKDYE